MIYLFRKILVISFVEIVHKIKQVRIHFAVEFCERGTGGGTVVGLSTDPAPLIISIF